MTEKLSKVNNIEADNEKLEQVKRNFFEIQENIAKSAQSVGKTADDIIFLAATKTVPVEIINYSISLGLKYIGENKVQEFLSKYEQYNLDNCKAHLIGHLQTNKVKQIVGKVDMIQSVDSLKLAQEISKISVQKNLTTKILIEVNIGGEESKSGTTPETVEELLYQVSALDNIKVEGLMTIPPICSNNSEIYKYFDKMNKLFIDISSKKIDNINMCYLSMGMSNDYQEAIKSGANMVRIGSSLYGARQYINK